MNSHYILEGHRAVACDLTTWANWFESHDRTVAKTTVSPEVRVSTVFLGLDHAFSPNEPPQIFETMVFGGPHDQDMQRYSTWDEAERGHASMVQAVN